MTDQRLKRTYLDEEAHAILIAWCEENDRTAYKVLSEMIKKELGKAGKQGKPKEDGWKS